MVDEISHFPSRSLYEGFRVLAHLLYCDLDKIFLVDRFGGDRARQGLKANDHPPIQSIIKQKLLAGQAESPNPLYALLSSKRGARDLPPC